MARATLSSADKMHDYEGSRLEFLKLLAQFGEPPAFLERAQAPQLALDALLRGCEARRKELLEWPSYHLAVLALRVGGDWARLARWLADAGSVAQLAALHVKLPTDKIVQASWLGSDKAVLRQFVESAERFNRTSQAYLDALALEGVNQPRREYNQFFVLEMECAFGSQGVAEGFVPLEMIDREYLGRRFPLMALA
jgi:hypothetical protein